MDKKLQVAWAAGLFEGEGSWIVRKTGYPQASLRSADRDVVERFAEIVGCGRIGFEDRKTANPLHSDSWYWQVGNRRDVRRLAETFMPYLGERRRTRALEIIAATEGWESASTSKYKTEEHRRRKP